MTHLDVTYRQVRCTCCRTIWLAPTHRSSSYRHFRCRIRRPACRQLSARSSSILLARWPSSIAPERRASPPTPTSPASAGKHSFVAAAVIDAASADCGRSWSAEAAPGSHWSYSICHDLVLDKSCTVVITVSVTFRNLVFL